ncbi:hypothetical protein N0V83_008975 [Neocucurbitaria cava]|uniref:Antifungal protein n=1 Tax=Neocucurbitaria cava TaxID=798079 RepID=A0A9W9CIP0_9PLEO|nr:hypothetical protein N0V83_008975 [Neocucurbitaria cava]
MVSILSIAALLVADIFAATATPLYTKEAQIYYCTDKKWKGTCHYQIVKKGTCANIDKEYNNMVTSILVTNSGEAKCKWFM